MQSSFESAVLENNCNQGYALMYTIQGYTFEEYKALKHICTALWKAVIMDR